MAILLNLVKSKLEPLPKSVQPEEPQFLCRSSANSCMSPSASSLECSTQDVAQRSSKKSHSSQNFKSIATALVDLTIVIHNFLFHNIAIKDSTIL